MRNASDLPMQLWKANLELQLRLGRLLQDSGREWMDLGTRAAGEGAAGLDAEVRKLLRGGDWQGLSNLPVEAFWRQAEQRVGDSQATAQLALQVQDGFVRGVVEALQDWQAQLARAWSDAGVAAGAMPDLARAWDGLMANWETGLETLVATPARARDARGSRAGTTTTAPAAAKPAAKTPPAARKAPASGGAASRTPAAKKTTAKKTASRKPAQKQGTRKRGG